MKRYFSLILLITFLFTSACTPRVQAPSSQDGAPVLRLLVLDDYSGSLRPGEAAELPDALTSLVSLLASGRGGMIAYGIIGTDASPLRRLTIASSVQDHREARLRNNPFLKLQARQDENLRIGGSGEDAADGIQDPSSPTEAFLSYLLSERRRLGTARHTNLAAALDRATIYFNEPTSFSETRDVLLLLTDGKDTTGRSYEITLPDTVTILLVHDRPDDLGILQSLRERITLFENTAAAVKHIQHNPDWKEVSQ